MVLMTIVVHYLLETVGCFQCSNCNSTPSTPTKNAILNVTFLHLYLDSSSFFM